MRSSEAAARFDHEVAARDATLAGRLFRMTTVPCAVASSGIETVADAAEANLQRGNECQSADDALEREYFHVQELRPRVLPKHGCSLYRQALLPVR